MTYTSRRVLIIAKTYPELSTRYSETVCTAGLSVDDGKPIRLYPVPLRYLEGDKQYALWDIINVPVDRSPRDQRPESYKINPVGLERVDHVGPDGHGWRNRRELLDRDPTWHYSGMASLNAANRNLNISIALVVPGMIDRVETATKPPEDRIKFERKRAALRAQRLSDMFDPTYHSLDYLPKEIYLHWRCADRCSTCSRKPHRMKVLDWGLMQLARKKSWEAAAQKLEELSDPSRHDFQLILGTFAQHPQNFGVIALWYPTRLAQLSLL